MEPYVFEIVLSHLEYITRIGHKNVASFFVHGHILCFPLFEIVEFGSIVAFYPAGFVKRNRFPATLSSVLVKQTVLNNFKLKLSYSADDFPAIVLVGEKLRYSSSIN